VYNLKDDITTPTHTRTCSARLQGAAPGTGAGSAREDRGRGRQKVNRRHHLLQLLSVARSSSPSPSPFYANRIIRHGRWSDNEGGQVVVVVMYGKVSTLITRACGRAG
jgi:hypothetical protein